ncbi:hypothetical protein CTI12_AA215230 [Artemisia annua]|uniref:Uncharacterized protein n=1 Tax=Artemisia annua TaxID=35608 RepID=A0A2U1NXZ3_ARTAN|nr:hypothetical protein CTI12_AA215230 [Artemisia annua]
MPLTSETQIIQLNAPTHLPIQLTASNFPVWRKQVQSTLIGLDLIDYIELNPLYSIWFRQDQILLSAILGSCSETIQPIISSVETSREAWERLNSSYASSSRSRIISLKSKLTKIPKGTRSVAEFLHEMKSIADELALAQSPILEEDLVVHILSQLGDEFNNIVAAIKVRESVISFSELFEKLVDFERMLKDSDSSQSTFLTTANVTQKSSFKFQPHNK